MAADVPLHDRLAGNGAVRWRNHQQSRARADHIRALLPIAGAAGLLIPTRS